LQSEASQHVETEGDTASGTNGAAQASTPGATNTKDAAAEAPTTVEEELAAAHREAEEYRGLLQRERADFINYRRRVDAERSGQLAQARADALMPILSVLDDLERAAPDVPEELREQPWVKGMLLILDKLAGAVQAAGLERIEALGEPFDPYAHEAFMYQPHEEIPAGNVSSVMRPGYRVGDRVVRPAQVAVSQGKPEAEGDGKVREGDGAS